MRAYESRADGSTPAHPRFGMETGARSAFSDEGAGAWPPVRVSPGLPGQQTKTFHEEIGHVGEGESWSSSIEGVRHQFVASTLPLRGTPQVRMSREAMSWPPSGCVFLP